MTFAVCANLFKRSARVDAAVKVDHIVVADAVETTLAVPAVDVGDGEMFVFCGRRTVDDDVVYLAHDWGLIKMDGLVFLGLLLFQLGIEVRAQFGVFRLDVDGHTEDAAGIDETFGEDAEDGFMDLSGGRYDETCDGKQEAADEHGNGRDDLHVFFCFFFHNEWELGMGKWELYCGVVF